MKELIKDLAWAQRENKKARKTGPYTLERTKHGHVVNWPEAVKKSWEAAAKVRGGKARITAALNLYHEIRGSDYRHNVPEEYGWEYKRELEALRKEYEIQ